MGDKTGIEWADATWNPIRGCSRVSEGCRNCYAESQANRFKGPGQPYEGLIAPGGQWNGQIMLVPEKLIEPLRWKKPRKIFVNSMSDLFHENVPFEYIASVFAIMSVTTRHTYQVLTKRPARMLEFFRWAMMARDDDGGWEVLQPDRYEYDLFRCGERIFEHWPEWIDWETSGYDNCGPAWPYQNIHLGVSIEDQPTAEERITLLLQVPAAVRFVSYEPALGAVDMTRLATMAVPGCELLDALRGEGKDFLGEPVRKIPKIGWVICGGESGKNARPMHPDWVRSLRDQCAAAGVPFLFKQHGEWISGRFDRRKSKMICDPSPEHQPIGRIFWTNPGQPPVHLWDEADHYWTHASAKVGKKSAGRLLDGRLHDEYPASIATPDHP